MDSIRIFFKMVIAKILRIFWDWIISEYSANGDYKDMGWKIIIGIFRNWEL